MVIRIEYRIVLDHGPKKWASTFHQKGADAAKLDQDKKKNH